MLHNAFSPADAGSPDSVAPSVCGSSASTTPRCDPMPSHFGHIGTAKPAVGKATANRAMPAAKRQGNAGKMLPPPFTEALLLQAIAELPDGTRRATETCYQCFQSDKFTTEDFLSFLRSIANQSRTLVRLFAEAKKEAWVKQTALANAAPILPPAMHQQSEPVLHAAGVARTREKAMCDLGLSDENDADEPAVDMTAKLIRRRRREARRRQLGIYVGSLAQRQGHFLTSVVRSLITKIPVSAKAELLVAVRSYVDHVTSPEEFRDVVQGLVDEHGVIVELDYLPEHEAREVTAKEMEQARIRSQRTNASQAQARKRSAGQHGSGADGATKRTKADSMGSRAAGGLPAMEAVDVPAFDHAEEEGRGCPACDLGMFADGAYGGRCPQCGTSSAARQAGRHAGAHASSLHGAGERWMGYSSAASMRPSGCLSPADLPATALGDYLTQQAQAVAPAQRAVRVCVASQTDHATGGGAAPRYPYRCKCILAFQKLGGADVIFFGMYVHEFSPKAPAPAAGRVYIECLDSIPLHGDTPADRQQLLTAVVHGYLRFVGSEGYRQVHIRVPPPSAENSHIFAYRSLKIRLEATLRMAQWYKRLLDGALQAGIVAALEGESHLSKLQSFPPCILSAADIAEEHAFSAMRSTAARLQDSGNKEGVDASVLQRLVSFKERFFVAHLAPSAAVTNRVDCAGAALSKCQMVARRRDLIEVCSRERLSFTTLDAAKTATAFILRHLLAAARPPPAGAAAAEHMLWQGHELPTLGHDDVKTETRGVHDDSSASARTTPPAQDAAALPKIEELSAALTPLTDNMLLDGAELVREDGVLEPLGDLDDAELFADSLFSA